MTKKKLNKETKAKPSSPIKEKKRGPDPFSPTDEQREHVKKMAGYGVPLHQVSSIIGISEKTLYKHFRDDIDKGKADANAQIGLSLFQQATVGESATAAIWWTKTQMGWKDTSKPEPIVSNNEDKQALIADALKVLAANLPV